MLDLWHTAIIVGVIVVPLAVITVAVVWAIRRFGGRSE